MYRAPVLRDEATGVRAVQSLASAVSDTARTGLCRLVSWKGVGGCHTANVCSLLFQLQSRNAVLLALCRNGRAGAGSIGITSQKAFMPDSVDTRSLNIQDSRLQMLAVGKTHPVTQVISSNLVVYALAQTSHLRLFC